MTIELTDKQREVATRIIARLGVRHESGDLGISDELFPETVAWLISVQFTNPSENTIKDLLAPLEMTVDEHEPGHYKGMFYDEVVKWLKHKATG